MPRSRPPIRTPLDSVYKDAYEPIALRSRRPNTKRLYRTTLKFFGAYLGRPSSLVDLNDATVSGFAAYRLDGGLAKSSVNKDLFNLLAFWRWLHKKGYVANWPDVALEVPPERTPVALLREEIDRLMTAIDKEHRDVGAIPGPVFWLAVFLVIWDTGERIGALKALTWDRVDLRGGWIRFVAEDRKGARADNLKRVAPDTIAALKALKTFTGRGRLVFAWPYSETYWYHRLAKIMRRADLPDNRLYKFHVVRKSMASHLKAAGGDPQKVLGHSSEKVTRKYIDPRIAPDEASPIDLLFRPGSGPSA